MPPEPLSRNTYHGTGVHISNSEFQNVNKRGLMKTENSEKSGSQGSTAKTSQCVSLPFKYDLGRVASRMMDDLTREGFVQDRRWHLKKYKQCFLHRDGFDWLVDHFKREDSLSCPHSVDNGDGMRSSDTVCSSFTTMEAYLEDVKVKAERLGNLLIAAGYISHVYDEHKFNAANRTKVLFFRFHAERIRRQNISAQTGVPLKVLASQSALTPQSALTTQTYLPHQHAFIQPQQPLPHKILTHNAMHTHNHYHYQDQGPSDKPQVLILPDIDKPQSPLNIPDERQRAEIDLLQAAIDNLDEGSDEVQQIEEERAAIALLQAEMERFQIGNQHQFTPEHSPVLYNSSQCPDLVYVLDDTPHDEISVVSMNSYISTISSKLLACDPNRQVDVGLLSIARDMHSDMTVLKQIKDRMWHLKVYKKCFLHEEALDWLAKQTRFYYYSTLDKDERPMSDDQAIQVAARVANLLIYHGYVSHVCKHHIFRPNITTALYFRFHIHFMRGDSRHINFGRVLETEVESLQRQIFVRETNVVLQGGPIRRLLPPPI